MGFRALSFASPQPRVARTDKATWQFRGGNGPENSVIQSRVLGVCRNIALQAFEKVTLIVRIGFRIS